MDIKPTHACAGICISCVCNGGCRIFFLHHDGYGGIGWFGVGGGDFGINLYEMQVLKKIEISIYL